MADGTDDTEGLVGADWLNQQRAANYAAARETTVQARLNILYRKMPVFMPPRWPGTRPPVWPLTYPPSGS